MPKEDFCVNLPMKIKEKELATAFREFKNDKADIGMCCEDLQNICFCDIIMAVDMKVRSANHGKNKSVETAVSSLFLMMPHIMKMRHFLELQLPRLLAC